MYQRVPASVYLSEVPELSDEDYATIEAAQTDPAAEAKAQAIIDYRAKLVVEARLRHGAIVTDARCDDAHKVLQEAKRRAGSDKIHRCPICDTRFRSIEALSMHRRETKHAFHQCPLCFETFATKKEVNEHMQRHEDLPEVVRDPRKQDRATVLQSLRRHPGYTSEELQQTCAKVKGVRMRLMELQTTGLATSVGTRVCSIARTECVIWFPSRYVRGEIVVDSRYVREVVR